MFPTSILLAVDGSEESMHAARNAVALSKWSGSELHVVYVEPVDMYSPERELYPPETRTDLYETFRGFAQVGLDDLTKKVREAGGDIAQTHARVGSPDKEIVRLAEELGAGLVVLGNRGLGAVRRALMGSVSTGVVRYAHCPVLVVRGEEVGEERGRPFGRILLAVDGSDESRAAAGVAAEVAGVDGAELHLISVVETETLQPYTVYPGPEEIRALTEAAMEERKEKAHTFAVKEAEHVKGTGARVDGVHVASGAPAKEIVEAAEDMDADLIVLGSRGLGGFRRALMGSVSDSVVRHAHCPVLVVRIGA
jgi:nucleotide-binding universal stress UspA family protein